MTEARNYGEARAVLETSRRMAEEAGGAYIDVRHSLELQRSLDRDQRGRSAAALKGAADADRLAASNRLLEERLALQRAELTNRTLKQRLAVAMAVAATIVGALFGCLFWMARRHKRYIRRQEAVLRTVSSYAPDALLLLDQQRRVRFCNRNLFGGVDTPEPGQTLDGIVPGGHCQRCKQRLKSCSTSVAQRLAPHTSPMRWARCGNSSCAACQSLKTAC